MAKRATPEPPKHGELAELHGKRVAEWQSIPEPGSSFRTEHFRCVDSLGLLLRNGSITSEMHDAGQQFSRTFVAAQFEMPGAPALDRIPGGGSHDSFPERVASARKRLHEALDAVGGVGSPAGCAIWHVAGLGCSVKEWAQRQGWNGHALNPHEAKGIVIAALGVLAGHYGFAR